MSRILRQRSGARRSRERLRHRIVIGKSVAERHAGDHELATGTEVRLEEHPDGVLPVAVGHESRRGARPALEFVAVHPSAATDRPLVDRPGAGRLERLHADHLGHVMAVDVIEVSVPRLTRDREEPRLGELAVVPDGPGDDRGMNDPDGVGIGDADRTTERA